MKRLAALLLLVGCASTAPYTRGPRPCQAQAVELVWRGCYGRPEQPPDVWWVPPADQTCGRVVNGARGFPLGSLCAGGASLGDNVSLVDFHAGWQGTALAHEMLHVSQAHAGLPPDAAHSPAFMTTVEACNARLRAARLCGP